jgi:hypothetical protein
MSVLINNIFNLSTVHDQSFKGHIFASLLLLLLLLLSLLLLLLLLLLFRQLLHYS